MKTPLRAALFDLDDTLFDHHHSRRAALTTLQEQSPCFARHDLTELTAAHERHLQTTHLLVLSRQLTIAEARLERMRLLFADFGVSLDTAQAESAERCYRVAYDVNRRAVPGVRELLAALHPHLKIVVVTNGITSEQTEKLTICGLTPFIHDLVTPHDAGAKKPDPRMFTFALARAECPAEAAIMVGDSWALDVVGARAAGLRSIWLDRHGEKCPEEGVTTRITQFEPSNKRWPQELRDAFPCL